MSNLDPIVLINRNGYQMTMARSRFQREYAILGFTEVSRVMADDESDGGAWGTGPRYVIAHTDGRRYAVTYDNWLYRYSGVGFTVVGLEVPVSSVDDVAWADGTAWVDAAAWSE